MGEGTRSDRRSGEPDRKKSRRVCRSPKALVRPMGERVRRGTRTARETTMKYMLIMRATDEAYAGMVNTDFDQLLDTMGKFNDELIRAGVLLAAEGLEDAAEGVVVDYSS